ncbi:MAG: hypothetical protein MI919_08640, partial [Holophagales bacterium]|nr:hypothetical protein [Holophagales bacterium]
MKTKIAWALVGLTLLSSVYLGPWLLEMLGYRLRLEPRLGQTTETHLDFASPPPSTEPETAPPGAPARNV